ncbi:hypothetical protein Pmgp_01435 [Pelotomaculum propionicicum]|uniref:Uncharacterized protein n=1 Tax=Pelotomaculum propionicicum TaxID=258475 RepID=A0A4Y7RSE2_9FIRM|nr:hypothetical protein Pmgp_01435 [Pelotomaculum propionicicum]
MFTNNVSAQTSGNDNDPWLVKPVLHYLLYTQDTKLESDVQQLKSDISLTNEELEQLRSIAAEEFLKCRDFKKQIENDKNISYEQELKVSLQGSDSKLKTLLGKRYPEFRKWIRQWWSSETEYRNQRFKKQGDISIKSDISSQYVYATQYDAYTDREAALPDKYLKFANYGTDYTYPNPPYTVNIRSQVVGQPEYWAYYVFIKEAGPWNENDNYWDSATGSNPRRTFTDLPLGKPEAEAAYFDNYNNGLDEFDRTVLNPAGVDLSHDVATELGFGGPLVSRWVEVFYTDLP